MSEIVEHVNQVESKLVTQFKDSKNLINYIKTLLLESDTLEQAFADIVDKRWIDTATGDNLDVIGAIVGQTRSFIDAEIFEYFAFQGVPGASSFGTVKDDSVGGKFLSVHSSTTGMRQLTDDEYRKFIRARIIKNRSTSTPTQIIDMLKFIFDIPLVILIDGHGLYEIQIGKKLPLNDKSIIFKTNIVPKTAGVKAYYTTQFNNENFFGFQGVPGASGFGSLNNLNSGGTFGEALTTET